MKSKAVVAAKDVAGVILILRGHRVVLDEDLARLYGVETRVLVQAVKRNPKRFPKDFMLQLNAAEWSALRSQIVISKTRRGGRRYAPYAFTEQGVAMLSSATAARPKGSSPNVRSTSIQEVVCRIQPPHQVRQRRLKGRSEGDQPLIARRRRAQRSRTTWICASRSGSGPKTWREAISAASC